MKKSIKAMPSFQSEIEERKFWEINDTSDYFDLANAVKVTMPNLKPSTASISLRLSQSFLEGVKFQVGGPLHQLSKDFWPSRGVG